MVQRYEKLSTSGVFLHLLIYVIHKTCYYFMQIEVKTSLQPDKEFLIDAYNKTRLFLKHLLYNKQKTYLHI